MIIYRDYEAVKSHLYKAAIALKKRHNYCEVEELVNAIYLAGGVLTVENPKYIQRRAYFDGLDYIRRLTKSRSKFTPKHIKSLNTLVDSSHDMEKVLPDKFQSGYSLEDIDLLNYLLLSVELTEEEDLIITAVFYRETKLNKIAKDMRMSIEQVEIHIEEALAKFRQLIGELDL